MIYEDTFTGEWKGHLFGKQPQDCKKFIDQQHDIEIIILLEPFNSCFLKLNADSSAFVSFQFSKYLRV